MGSCLLGLSWRLDWPEGPGINCKFNEIMKNLSVVRWSHMALHGMVSHGMALILGSLRLFMYRTFNCKLDFIFLKVFIM